MSQKAAHVSGEPKGHLDDRRRTLLAAYDAFLDAGPTAVVLNDADPLRVRKVDHRGQVGRVKNRIALAQPFKYTQQIGLGAVVKIDPRFLQQQHAVLEFALAGVAELPGKRNVPPEAGRAPAQADRYSHDVIGHENIEGGAVDIQLELHLALGPAPQIAKLLGQIGRGGAFVESAIGSSRGSRATVYP